MEINFEKYFSRKEMGFNYGKPIVRIKNLREVKVLLKSSI
jgi:hypothetical protein